LELLISGDEVQDLLAQVFDLGLQLGDTLLPVSDQEMWGGGGQLGRMELVLGLGPELVEGSDAARTGADRQGQCVGALPRRERHVRSPERTTRAHRILQAIRRLRRFSQMKNEIICENLRNLWIKKSCRIVRPPPGKPGGTCPTRPTPLTRENS